MKGSRVNWIINAILECPYCGHDNDFMDIDEFWTISDVGQNVENIENEKTECEECGKEFKIIGADY